MYKRQAFTALATKLADALHTEGLQLALTLGTPSLIDNGWDTGGQNWAALGRVADVVYLHMPLDPTTYGDGGPAEQLVGWATGQIDRRKLNLLPVSYTHLRAHETVLDLVCRLLLEKKKTTLTTL